MGLVLIIFIAAIACLSGWIAHIIEKWLRRRPISREEIEHPPCPPSQPTSVHRSKSRLRFSETDSPSISVPSEAPQPLHAEPPSIIPHQITGIDAKFEECRGEGADKYPPDWKYRAIEVRERDGDRCRVAGCPSIGIKHVHHLRAISKGGSHALSNLITLCEFHHALMPGHLEAIGENINSDRFGVRRGHIQGNQVRAGYHFVNPSITRYKLADSLAILDMVANQRCMCPTCKTGTFECERRQEKGWPILDHAGITVSLAWRLICQDCGRAWYLPQGLAEEVGLVLARVFHQSSAAQLVEYEQEWLEKLPFLEVKPCPRHDCLGHLIPIRNQQNRRIFNGCSKYHETGCRGRL